jgi:uncharacterized protein (DUF1697 family)
MNCKMPQLKGCFEAAGFTQVKTVLASGNVVFDSRAASDTALERKAEAAMEEHLGRSFYAIVRRVDELGALLAADPFARFKLPADAKRVVTFLRKPAAAIKLPIELEHARILAAQGREVFTAYVPTPGNPVFMTLIEKTFGKDVTTRTWDTVTKCAAA